MEHETAKLKELDESYSGEFTEWKNNLKPRKQVGDTFEFVLLLFLFTFIMGVKFSHKDQSSEGLNYSVGFAHKTIHKKNCAAF